MNREKSSTTSILGIIRQVCLGLSVGLLSVSIASAQSSVSGRVSGRVTDKTGAIIPGSHISALMWDPGIIAPVLSVTRPLTRPLTEDWADAIDTDRSPTES